MDISSLPEAEQQKLQQLQIRFQEHQAQQQQAQQEQQQPQNQQDHASQPHDPSQYHQYQDQSAQSYDYAPYQHYPQQNQPQPHHYEQHLDQHYAYYQSDYANTYQPQQPYAPPDPVQPQVFVAGLGPVQQQQNVYYPTQSAQGGGGEPPSSAAYPGLNAAAAAAVAALSQLTHFAGTMVAAEKAMYGPPYIGHGTGPIPSQARSSRYGDGGRRGVGASRGGGQRRGGPGPTFRGGRGRGRARRGPVHVPSNDKSSHSEPPVAKDGEIINEEAGPSAPAPETAAPASVLADTSSAASSAEKVAAKQKTKQAATCELCKIECTSLEILEQHKNGKRHKKNLLRIEELKKAIKPVPAIQIEQNSDVSQQPETKQNCAENKLMEGLTVEVEAGGDKNQAETKEQNHTGSQSEGPVVEPSDTQTVKLKVDRSNSRKGGKRKMGGAQGGRRLKTFGAPRRPIEPHKPKVPVALICELCNAKCDTREVLDRHLSGKKHIAKLKRFQGHQAHNVQTGLQALYPPPNPIVQTLFRPLDHQQHFYTPQSLFPPPGAYMPPQGPHEALPSASGIDPQLQTIPQTHGSVATLDPGTQNAVAVVAQQLQIQ